MIGSSILFDNSAGLTISTSSQIALETVTASTIGVPLASVTFEDISETGSSRKLFIAEASSVTAILAVTVSTIYFTAESNPDSIYASMQLALNNAVTDGSFSADLSAAEIALGSNTWGSATGVSYSALQVISPPSFEPSAAPSTLHHMLLL